MTQGEIIVPATAEQRKNFQDIVHGQVPFREKFMKRLKEKDSEYTKKYKPFCYTCAKIDYEDEVLRVEREIERQTGKIDSNNEKLITIDIGDLEKYGKEDIFSFLKFGKGIGLNLPYSFSG